MNALTAHWELKLVAIVLAVALWIYTSGQVRSDRTVDVQVRPENVAGLGDNYQITAITPSQFRVTVSVPSSRWNELPANDLLTPRLEVRGDALKNREQGFSVTSSLLGLSSDVRIVRTEPENLRELTLHWDYIVEDELPAEPPALANVPPGLEAEARLDLNLVGVRAAAYVIERERRLKTHVRFQPIDLGFADAGSAVEQQRRAELTPAPNLPYKVQRTPVATIVLRPIPAAVLISGVPVHVLVPRETVGRFHVDVAPAQVTLNVRGPENLLKTFKAETDLTAYVDLRHGMQPGAEREAPVALLAPSWLTFDPLSVRVTVAALPESAEATPAPEAHPTPQPATTTVLTTAHDDSAPPSAGVTTPAPTPEITPTTQPAPTIGPPPAPTEATP